MFLNNFVASLRWLRYLALARMLLRNNPLNLTSMKKPSAIFIVAKRSGLSLAPELAALMTSTRGCLPSTCRDTSPVTRRLSFSPALELAV